MLPSLREVLPSVCDQLLPSITPHACKPLVLVLQYGWSSLEQMRGQVLPSLCEQPLCKIYSSHTHAQTPFLSHPAVWLERHHGAHRPHPDAGRQRARQVSVWQAACTSEWAGGRAVQGAGCCWARGSQWAAR